MGFIETESTKFIREYLDKHPDIKGKLTIARQCYKLRPDLWNDHLGDDGTVLISALEKCRSTVRYVTGSVGEYQRSKVIESKTNNKNQKYFFNGFEQWSSENLNTEPQPWDTPFEIPSSIKQLNIIADLHSVYLNKDVMTKFLRATNNKEALLLNGDLMDSSSLSRHLKGHNVIEYEKEIELAYQILKGLKEEFTHIYFKEGNHDFWLERYLLTNARDIFKVLGMSLKELLRLGELGVHHIHNLQSWKYNDLDGIHGHEFPGFGMGKFPSVGLLDKWQTFKNRYDVKVIASHSHREDMSISRKSKDGRFGYAWVTPCFCNLGAQYAPFAGWNQGWTTAKIGEYGVDVKITKV